MRAVKCAAIALAGAALCACAATHGGQGAPVLVDVPTPIACPLEAGPTPDYPDTDAALIAAPDLFSRVRLLAAGRLLRMARERELVAAVAGCAQGQPSSHGGGG
jgi:hypothetical protein